MFIVHVHVFHVHTLHKARVISTSTRHARIFLRHYPMVHSMVWTTVHNC